MNNENLKNLLDNAHAKENHSQIIDIALPVLISISKLFFVPKKWKIILNSLIFLLKNISGNGTDEQIPK